jgi:electron transport complex protein RnfG
LKGRIIGLKRKIITTILLLCLVVGLFGCGRQNTALTDAEAAAITEISGMDASGFSDISREVLSKDIAARFPAAVKVHRYENLYALIVKPIAYNGPITLALVIDSDRGESVGLRIVEHVETPQYVRDMENMWFVDRFANKSVREYLTLVRLHAQAANEIVAITGATVTTEGIINGVNAAFGVYQEFALGLTAGSVPYMVRFAPGEGDGPVETESLAIRAYGVVLAEVSLEDIRALPSVRRTLNIHSTAGVTQHSFRGTLLSNVLDLVDPNLKEQYRWLLAIGVDDFISGIGMDEVRAENNVFIMYEDNDEPLLKRTGEPGAMRIVVINDFFGQRFTNFLLEIVLESENLS